MIFEQTFPVYFSLTGVITLVAVIFTLEFYFYRKEVLHSLSIIPSIIFLGPKFGTTSMIKEITNRDVVPHAKDERFHVSYFGNKNKMQLIAPKNFNLNDSNFIKSMKNMNYKSFVYVFDVSPFSDPIEQQIGEFNKIQNTFGGRNIVVAHKTEMTDHEKLKKLRNSFSNMHEISLINKTGFDQLRNSIMSSMEN